VHDEWLKHPKQPKAIVATDSVLKDVASTVNDMKAVVLSKEGERALQELLLEFENARDAKREVERMHTTKRNIAGNPVTVKDFLWLGSCQFNIRKEGWNNASS